ncbi:hypothetical protein [Herbidospora daliensis]|uniref:hypothetical protein n=1 Tax=Herbidospora daliensis TaxID=295585 RepID=UPI000783B041|nr:hypothetical protein [Herbidospora daliensis]
MKHLCLDYYRTRRLIADPNTPIDRWGQAPDTRDIDELVTNLRPLVERHGISVLIEPFAGLGSGALAARMLRLMYAGAELNPKRADVAIAKAFASTDVTLAVLDMLAMTYGSRERALEIVREDLAAAPEPVVGEIYVGNFRNFRPDLPENGKRLFHLCPPFPRRPATVEHFQALMRDTLAWLQGLVRTGDLLVAEYFNYTARFDVGLEIERGFRTLVDDATIVVTSLDTTYDDGGYQDRETGYSGFVLGSPGFSLQPPPEWFVDH